MRVIQPLPENLSVPITRGELNLFKELIEEPDSPLQIMIRLDDMVLKPVNAQLNTSYVRKKNPDTGKFEKYPAHVELLLQEVRIADNAVLFDVDKLRPVEDYLCLANKFNVQSDFFDIILSIHSEKQVIKFMPDKSFFCLHQLGLHDKQFVTMELGYFMDYNYDLYCEWKQYAADLVKRYLNYK